MQTSKVSLALLFACTLAGCASTYKQEVMTAHASPLLSDRSVAIGTPANGSYDGKAYTGSGASTAGALRSAFARHTNKAVISTCVDVDCFKMAQGARFDYYVVTQILHWEDRATEWSGKKDKLELKVTVYSGADWSEISSFMVNGKSKWATFGGDHPQDLLAAPIDGYVATLYN